MNMMIEASRSKIFVAALSLAAMNSTYAQTTRWEPSPGHKQIPLWPSTPPGTKPKPDSETVTLYTKKPVGGRPWTYISNVSRPTLTVYPPKGENTGAAIMVFPGGGYQILAIDLEGTEVCDWLTSKGITCVLLKYRVPRGGPSHQDDCDCRINPKPAPAVQDAQRAMGIIRLHAAEWQINPTKIGVIGFSAGGHLVAAISNDWQKRLYTPIDAADRQDARPDFAISLYPGHLWEYDTKDPLGFNPDLHVTAKAPPTFMLHAQNDSVDNPNHTLSYYAQLRRAGVPVELHIFAEGGHGFGLRRTKYPITEWPALVEKWMRTIGAI
jgi:acetyl esterase/lipase